MAATMKGMVVIASSLLLLLSSTTLAARPVERKALADNLLGKIGLVPVKSKILDLEIPDILSVELDAVYAGPLEKAILKFVDTKDPRTLLQITSALTKLTDISVLDLQLDLFNEGALVDLDAELLGLLVLDVQVLKIDGITNYLFKTKSADGTLRQLIRAFVGCGRLNILRAQTLATNWHKLHPIFRKSLLSYVLEAVVCLVKGVLSLLDGLLGPGVLGGLLDGVLGGVLTL